MTSGLDHVTFEQPLTERVRTFLRLEFLFAQHRHHQADHDGFGIRATLHALLDILTVLSRSDLKNEILKELTDRHVALTKLAARPGVDQERLQLILKDITASVNGLQQLATQFAASVLRDNDFLTAVMNRSTIPGGTCAFDLPVYHYWLSQPYEIVERNLSSWFADIKPFEQAILLYLRLLRSSVEPQEAVAQGGIYMQTPPGPCSLLRVHVPMDAHVYPEISAGKHRFT
ncbi:MAG TPA: cell division protein ZapD, partial [Nevskiaceae bacterium]|nr:cell division protein ZapD [Nevskiaceae bacterium]